MNSRTNVPVDRERTQHIKTIQKFCAEPAQNGGMLLVCGPRGAGKTWLVDAALNEGATAAVSSEAQDRAKPDGLMQWFDYLSGDCFQRRRRSVTRMPRQLTRFLIPVQVRPFFPVQSTVGSIAESATAAENPRKSGSDEGESTRTASVGAPSSPTQNSQPSTQNPTTPPHEPAYHLILNLCHALTSYVDPRPSPRHWGRTLRTRLGFRKYWFSRTALWLPGDIGRRSVFVWMSALILTAAILFGLWNHYALGVLIPCWQALLLGALIPMIAWLLLRWADWRAFIGMSAKLYDLSHADSLLETHSDQRGRGFDWKPTAAFVTGLVLLASGALIPLTKGTGLPDLTLGSLATLGGGFGLLFFSWRHREDHQARFGGRNLAWRITLINRYLHVAHRCGIEPVLVVDELDKLEESANASTDNRSPSARNRDPCLGQSSLEQFLCALLRLKHDLAADFLWILVGSQELFTQLQRDRRHSPSPGPLATLIQQVCTLGPVHQTVAKEHLDARGVPSDEATYIWLTARGLFAGLQRQAGRLDEPEEAFLKRGEWLEESVNALWNCVEKLEIYFPTIGNCASALRNKEDWYLIWLRTGMLQFAYQLLYAEMYRISHLEMEMLLRSVLRSPETDDAPLIQPYCQALAEGSPELLTRIGRLLLYNYLFNKGMIADSDQGEYLMMQAPSTDR